MNKKEKKFIEEIYKNCVLLERRKDLTEFGAGQGILCGILLKKKKMPFKLRKRKVKCKNCKKIYILNDDIKCVFCDAEKLVLTRGN